MVRLTPSERVKLEIRMGEERMTAVDPDAPPALDGGVRVEILTCDGALLPWAFADAVDWREAFAMRVADDGSREKCEGCGRFVVDPGATGKICQECWESGDWEMDGDADEAEGGE